MQHMGRGGRATFLTNALQRRDLPKQRATALKVNMAVACMLYNKELWWREEGWPDVPLFKTNTGTNLFLFNKFPSFSFDISIFQIIKNDLFGEKWQNKISTGDGGFRRKDVSTVVSSHLILIQYFFKFKNEN